MGSMPSPYIGPNVRSRLKSGAQPILVPLIWLTVAPLRSVPRLVSILVNTYQENATLTCKMQNAKILDANVLLF